MLGKRIVRCMRNWLIGCVRQRGKNSIQAAISPHKRGISSLVVERQFLRVKMEKNAGKKLKTKKKEKRFVFMSVRQLSVYQMPTS